MPVVCIQLLHPQKRHHSSPRFSSILFHLHLVLLQLFLLLHHFVVCVLFFLQCIGTIKINMATCYLQYYVYGFYIFIMLYFYFVFGEDIFQGLNS
ncbi:hypothetical protein C0J52_18375 [Blattella germanica]|nr:hypothetical protein C0J52_18375 [Blattella germanica]